MDLHSCHEELISAPQQGEIFPVIQPVLDFSYNQGAKLRTYWHLRDASFWARSYVPPKSKAERAVDLTWKTLDSNMPVELERFRMAKYAAEQPRRITRRERTRRET